jgi:hydroxyethylthiazole kinase-like uncharacterized protein yjeF
MLTTLTRAQVRRLDAIAINELGIPGVVLMENAGHGAAEIIRDLIAQRQARRAVIFCGRGNNGGDGLVIARHLHNAGESVATCLTVPPSELRGDAEINYRILERMGLEVVVLDGAEALRAAAAALTARDLVVDALLGTGFEGNVREPLAGFIGALNAAPKAATVAVDIPSGLDCDTGRPGGVAIRADVTVTFVAPKLGLVQAAALEWTGTLHVVGIGTPPSLIERVIRDLPAEPG